MAPRKAAAAAPVPEQPGAKKVKAEPEDTPPQDRHSDESKTLKPQYAALLYKLKKRNESGEDTKSLHVYKSLPNEEKKNWVAKFKLDPSLAWCTAESSTSVSSRSSSNSEVRWLTQDQIAAPTRLNNAEHARMICESGVLRDQPHEFEPLALAGVRQYEWNDSWKSVTDAYEERTKIKATGDMSTSDFEAAQQHMDSELPGLQAGPAPVRTKATPKKVRTPEQQATFETQKAVGQSLSKAAQCVQKVSLALREDKIDPLCHKLDQKDWGAPLKASFLEKVKQLRVDAGSLHDLWANLTKDQKSGAAVDRSSIDEATNTLSVAYGAFEKSLLADIKNMTG